MYRDSFEKRKPNLKVYKDQEFENEPYYKMEFIYKVKFKVGEEEYDCEYTGLIQRLDELNRNLYGKVNPEIMDGEDKENKTT